MTVTNLHNYKAATPSCVTIGVFDGVHLGHQKILERLCKTASTTSTTSTLLTFSEHPRIILNQHKTLKLLNTFEEKLSKLGESALEHVVVVPFTKEFAALEAEAFVKTILVETLCAQTVIVGYDHRFGKNRSSSLEDLVKYGYRYGFSVEEIPAQEIDHTNISSTKIRAALEAGNIKLANSYLGYTFMLSGVVITGKKIGRVLGFPTANLELNPCKIVPKDGVYVVRCNLNGNKTFGMMNIGYKPTVGGTQKSVEVYLFDFESDLYGQTLDVEVIKRMRDEMAFTSLKALKTQLQKDRETAQQILRGEKMIHP